MKTRHWIGIAAAGLALALPLAAQQAATQPAPRAKERKAVVVRDGERIEVFEDGDRPMRRIFVGGGYLGISPVALTDELRAHFGAGGESGVMVGKVFDDTPAARAGLKVGDIITQVDGKQVDSTWDITRALGEKKKGDQVRIDYVRDRAATHAFVTVDYRPADSAFTFVMPEIPPIEIDGEALEKAMEGARAMVKVAPNARVFRSDCEDLQTRIKDLESRLKELEKRLK